MIVLLAAKSAVIAGGTMLVLRFMRGRSASDRSWIAHLGLAALAALPLGSLLVPPLEVTTSSAVVLGEAAMTSTELAWIAPIAPAFRNAVAEQRWVQAAADWLILAHGAVALLLIARTLLALLRLVLLTARAQPVTDDHWREALARVQRRTGFTNNTALLTSREIASPMSWGVMRPKILINTEAIAARADTDAIMAHELAHIARADWAKLVLARISVALLWFNPLAWLLAREAHQLREEAADDAVLAAGVEDTAYASLLVSAARRQRESLALGAHGIAPARNSLAERVRRVLDRGLNRSASGTRWDAAMAVGAAALTAPLMTLQFANTAPAISASTPLASDDNAEVTVFELRRPPGGVNVMPKYTQEASDQAVANGESLVDAVPAGNENGL